MSRKQRAWSSRQQRQLNAISLAVLNALGGAFVISSLVLSSRILPVPYWLLVLAGAVVGLLASLPTAIPGIRRWHFIILAVFSCVITLVGASAIFFHFQRSGLVYAKRYAERWAAIVQARHTESGNWPLTLREGAQAESPKSNLPWPYLAFCENEVCSNIAGYYIVYLPTKPRPILRVARRDVRVEWDWVARKWKPH
jgi:hypothetical protein